MQFKLIVNIIHFYALLLLGSVRSTAKFMLRIILMYTYITLSKISRKNRSNINYVLYAMYYNIIYSNFSSLKILLCIFLASNNTLLFSICNSCIYGVWMCVSKFLKLDNKLAFKVDCKILLTIKFCLNPVRNNIVGLAQHANMTYIMRAIC